jgi:hypothetical protein
MAQLIASLTVRIQEGHFILIMQETAEQYQDLQYEMEGLLAVAGFIASPPRR